eukprot:TRINITY_DN2842_c1_g2_i1.p1 TRINITY_DN2842_c1_g2~~TRINITY_DN2842_c1_g2_i1.p1  ORF type:complete len:602 (+),score=89.22 TRINITY_DN2842_c1_g2_i1:117-1922(+)
MRRQLHPELPSAPATAAPLGRRLAGCVRAAAPTTLAGASAAQPAVPLRAGARVRPDTHAVVESADGRRFRRTSPPLRPQHTTGPTRSSGALAVPTWTPRELRPGSNVAATPSHGGAAWCGQGRSELATCRSGESDAWSRTPSDGGRSLLALEWDGHGNASNHGDHDGRRRSGVAGRFVGEASGGPSRADVGRRSWACSRSRSRSRHRGHAPESASKHCWSRSRSASSPLYSRSHRPPSPPLGLVSAAPRSHAPRSLASSLRVNGTATPAPSLLTARTAEGASGARRSVAAGAGGGSSGGLALALWRPPPRRGAIQAAPASAPPAARIGSSPFLSEGWVPARVASRPRMSFDAFLSLVRDDDGASGGGGGRRLPSRDRCKGRVAAPLQERRRLAVDSRRLCRSAAVASPEPLPLPLPPPPSEQASQSVYSYESGSDGEEQVASTPEVPARRGDGYRGRCLERRGGERTGPPARRTPVGWPPRSRGRDGGDVSAREVAALQEAARQRRCQPLQPPSARSPSPRASAAARRRWHPYEGDGAESPPGRAQKPTLPGGGRWAARRQIGAAVHGGGHQLAPSKDFAQTPAHATPWRLAQRPVGLRFQ